MEEEWEDLVALCLNLTQLRNKLSDALREKVSIDLIEKICTRLQVLVNTYEGKWLCFSVEYDLVDDVDKAKDFNDHFMETWQLITQAKQYIQTYSVQPNLQSRHANPNSPDLELKMSDIRLEEFDRNPLEQTKFKNKLTSPEHGRTDDDDIPKYSHDTQCVKILGSDLPTGFKEQVSEDQDNIIRGKRRFKRILSRKLVQLKEPKYNLPDILCFKVELEKILIWLEHDIGIEISEADWLIRELIMMKLPDEATDFLFSLHKTLYCNLTQIKEGLQLMVEYLTMFEDDASRKKVTPTKSSACVPDHNHVPRHTRSDTTASVGTSATGGCQLCFFCKQNHKTYDCKKYTTIHTRRDRLKEMNRCQKCIKVHDTNECNTVLSICPHCHKGKHHSFLCMSNPSVKPKSINAANASKASWDDQ